MSNYEAEGGGSKQEYQEKGFSLVDTNLRDQILELRQKFIATFNKASLANGGDSVNSDSDLIDIYHEREELWHAAFGQIARLPDLHKLASGEKIVNLARDCGLSNPVFFDRINIKGIMPFDLSHDLPTHQDFPSHFGSLNSVTIWIPFQDTDEKLGAVQVVPGSHRAGVFPSKNRIIEDDAILRDLHYVDTPVRAGQALVFSQMLVHRSGKNTSDSVRFACQVRFNDLECTDWAKRKFFVFERHAYKDNPDLEGSEVYE